MENWIFVGVAAIAAIAALWLAFLILRAIYAGALFFLQWALAQGFVGVAAFVACWVLMLPVTLIACAVVGFGAMRVMKEQDRVAREIPLTRQRLGLDP
jgi:hypothetical protein